MSDLLKKPFGKRGKVHQITPESAGWRYVGFSLYHLKAGDKAAEATGDREVILVLVEGKAAITGAGQDWGVLGDRMNVFEKTPPIVCTCPMARTGARLQKPIAFWRSVPPRGWAGIRPAASGPTVSP